MHNIPEGMTVGLVFGVAANENATVTITITAVMVLALGIALQNFLEVAAISLPLKKGRIIKYKSIYTGSIIRNC